MATHNRHRQLMAKVGHVQFHAPICDYYIALLSPICVIDDIWRSLRIILKRYSYKIQQVTELK